MFGRPIKDHLPDVSEHGKEIDQHWKAMWNYKARSNQTKREYQRLNKDKLGRKYTDLQIAQYICIQDTEQTSSFAKSRWRTWGTIKDILPYNQYIITLEWTNTDIRRNRKFLKPANANPVVNSSTKSDVQTTSSRTTGTGDKGHGTDRATPPD